MITLSEALKNDRLAEFIAQEEGRGIGPASTTEVERAIKLLATRKQSSDRTSRSASRGGSGGK